MSFSANVYLAILAMVASVCSFVAAAMGQSGSHQVDIAVTKPKTLFLFGLFFSSLSFVLTLQAIGVRLADVLSPQGIMRVAQAATYQRYTQGIDFAIYYNISNAFLLAYAMAVAVILAYQRSFRLHLLLPLGIFVASNILITTRAPILFMLLMMVFSLVFSIKLRYGRLPPMFSIHVVRIGFVGVTFVAGMFFLFQILRFGESSTRGIADVWEHLRRWPWGSLPGFSLWFDGYGASVETRPSGYYTFMGLYDILGISDRQVGGFGDYLHLTSTEVANIYTVFRGLWHDFGAVGSAIFLGLISMLAGLSLHGTLLRNVAISLIGYVAVMSFLSWSFVFSFWAYTANLTAFAVFPVLLSFCFSISGTTISHKYRNN